MKSIIARTALILGLSCVAVTSLAPRPAAASTQDTAAIVAGAALIVGALLEDNSGRSYYVNRGHRYYVSNDEANYYRDRNDRNGWNNNDRGSNFSNDNRGNNVRNDNRGNNNRNGRQH